MHRLVGVLRSRALGHISTTPAYRLEALEELHAAGRMRACVRVVLHARYLHDCSVDCVGKVWSVNVAMRGQVEPHRVILSVLDRSD